MDKRILDPNDSVILNAILDEVRDDNPELYKKFCDQITQVFSKESYTNEEPPKKEEPKQINSTILPNKFGESGTVALTSSNVDGTKTYTAIITGEVQAPSKYIQLLDVLYNAKKGDNVIIKIASPGGMVETGAALFTAFENTQAKVTTIGMGTVASIASLIWMAGHDREMMPGSTLMVHGPSGMQMGKVSSIKEECEQISEYFKYMLVTLSKGILTDEQLQKVLDSREDLFIPAEVLNDQIIKMAGGQNGNHSV